MCRPWLWFWGVIPLALVVLLTLYLKPAPIAEDLASRAADVLAGQDLAWAKVAVDGRDLILSGISPSEQAQAQARDLVADVWGVRRLIDETTLLAMASPFLWSARLDGDSIFMTGNVPSSQARADLLSAAQSILPGHTVDDSALVAARGVSDPQVWSEATAFALSQLAGLESGEVSLDDLMLSVSGSARSSDIYESLLDALAEPPEGVTVAVSPLLPPLVTPNVLEVTFAGRSLSLSGHAPSRTARAALLEAAEELFANARVDAELSIARGGLDELAWITAAGFLLQQTARLKEGGGSLIGDELTVRGEAATVETYTLLQAALEEPPAGLGRFSHDILPAAAESFAWTAAFEGDGVTVFGFVPDEAVKQRIAATVDELFPGTVLADRMRVAAGPDGATPRAWIAGSTFALEQLARLQSGRVLMTPGNLTVNGTATDPGTFDLINDALSVPPEGFEVVRSAITPATVQDFAWEAVLSNDTIRIGGYAVSVEARNELVELFVDARAGSVVESTVQVAGGPLDEDAFDALTEYAADLLGLFSEGRVVLSGARLSVSGTARDVDAFKEASEALEEFPDGVTRGDVELRPAAIGVLTWTATRDREQVALDGFVPSEAVRRSVRAAAEQAVPDGSVDDRMEIAEGGAEAAIWGNATEFALRQLGRMTRGQVRLSGTDFSIQGVAPDFAAYEAILEEVPGALPGGLQLAGANILPPVLSPYVWGAKRDPASIVLSGHVPSDEVRREVTEFARSRFAGVTVTDEMKLASGAPDAMLEAVGVAFAALGKLTQGAVSLVDRRLTLTGETVSEEERNSADQLIAGQLPTGYSGSSSIRVAVPQPEPPLPGRSDAGAGEDCQQALNTILAEKTIQFEVNSANIRQASFAVLDRLVSAANGCPQSRIEVAGHTDADGPEDYNRQLSQQRAESVVRYLIGAGVAETRLTAVGYGESQPVASNDNDAGKARNRRIEFTVLQ